MSAPVIVQPDLEAWVWANLKDQRGVTSFAFTALQPDHTGWSWVYGIQVDARAARKKAARDLAETCRQRVLALAELAWSEGQITYVSVTEGPSWLPDDPDGAPRYTTRFEIRVHPRRSNPSDTEKTGGSHVPAR